MNNLINGFKRMAQFWSERVRNPQQVEIAQEYERLHTKYGNEREWEWANPYLIGGAVILGTAVFDTRTSPVLIIGAVAGFLLVHFILDRRERRTYLLLKGMVVIEPAAETLARA